MTTKEETAWLAALYEGEGSCGRYRNGRGGSYFLRLQITSTDEDVIESARRIAGCGRIYKFTRAGRKLVYRWQTSRREDVELVAGRILPLLHARRARQLQAILQPN